MTKSSALRIRVDPELHREFLDVCKRLDVPAAQVLRQHMRKIVDENRDDIQDDLFTGSDDQNEDRGE
ncbi:MAG: hypothetical protein KZQ89_20035 [Candidatus Thiodiazotropha sp. (ex Lucinoma kastoroae)]|nr:hypothetical protein [Candidatus Thiodiazotropha sp. (ex Lucinoma kastoroae)]